MPGKRFVIGVPYVWLTVFFFLPFLILLYISFVDMGNDIHPFKPLLEGVKSSNSRAEAFITLHFIRKKRWRPY